MRRAAFAYGSMVLYIFVCRVSPCGAKPDIQAVNELNCAYLWFYGAKTDIQAVDELNCAYLWVL